MPESITAELLGKLKPRSAPYEIRDTKQRGFLVRVQPSGRAAFVVEYGRGRRLTLGPVDGEGLMLKRARALARQVLAAADTPGITRADLHRIVHPQAPAQSLTLGSYLETVYGPWAKQHRRRGAADVARIRRRFAELLEVPLTALDPWRIETWRLARAGAGRSAHTVNRDLAPLKAALARAVQWGHLGADPLAAVKLARTEDNSRVRYLDADEEQRLRDALAAREQALHAARARGNAWRKARGRPPRAAHAPVYADHLQPMVLLALNTGLRQGELFALRWTDIDADRCLLTVRAAAAKGGKLRRIPLNVEAARILEAWRAQRTDRSARAEAGAAPAPDPHDADLVFPGRRGARFTNVKRAWTGVVHAAGLDDFRWHDLRHSFASKLVMRGVDLNTVRELLGHADLKMTLRYAHLAPGHLAEAVARLDAPAVAPDPAPEAAPVDPPRRPRP